MVHKLRLCVASDTGASQPNGSAAMGTVGSGDYAYEEVDVWGKPTASWVVRQDAVVTDSKDWVCRANPGGHPLVVLDRDSNYLTSWSEGILPDSCGMFIDGD